MSCRKGQLTAELGHLIPPSLPWDRPLHKLPGALALELGLHHAAGFPRPPAWRGLRLLSLRPYTISHTQKQEASWEGCKLGGAGDGGVGVGLDGPFSSSPGPIHSLGDPVLDLRSALTCR